MSAKMETKPARAVKLNDTVLRCRSGYHFEQIGRNRVALMKDDGGSTGMSAKCGCAEDGTCGIVQEGVLLRCSEANCAGACIWTFKNEAIVGNFELRKL
jgi:hypothetical protein